MSDTTIIWELISVTVTKDHPILYQYIKGRVNSKQSAIMRLTGLVAPMFIGACSDAKVRGVVRTYLSKMEKDYKAGKITIKPIYS